MSSRPPARALKSLDELIAAGFVAPERARGAGAGRGALRDGADAGAGAPDRHRAIRAIRSRASSCPTRASSCATRPRVADPIGDAPKSPLKGLVHRYRDRVLIKLAAVCAVYCRFCFRREMIGPGARALSAEEFAAALAYVRARPQIWEAVLTGGDPLVLSPRRLAETTTRGWRRSRISRCCAGTPACRRSRPSA